MAETAGRDTAARTTRRPVRRLRPDRVYLGWQFALPYPDPGPPPRRPTPPERPQLDTGWVAAQRHAESQLNRPLTLLTAAALGLAGAVLVTTAAGSVHPLLAAVPIAVCLVLAGVAGYARWQGRRVLERRIEAERQRLHDLRAAQERDLFAAQERHARHYQLWQDSKVAYERQLQWYAVAVPETVDRIDVVGGTVAGWSALATMVGAGRVSAGGELTVLDLSEGAVAADLVRLTRQSGQRAPVWVLPEDLAKLDVGAGLGRRAFADVLALAAAADAEGAARDVTSDAAVLERVLEALEPTVDIRRVTAVLRALAREGGRSGDTRPGPLTREEIERVMTRFRRSPAERDARERARELEKRLRKLEPLGTRPATAPTPRLRVVAAADHGELCDTTALATYVATALAHQVRAAPAGKPWRHALLICGADRLHGEVLDRLVDACAVSRTGLVMCYRTARQHVRSRLGTGNAAVGVMRVGEQDAHVAMEHLGAERRLVLSRLTEAVGTSGGEPVDDSYTSTVGDRDVVDAFATESPAGDAPSSAGVAEAPDDAASSPARDADAASATVDSDARTELLGTNTAWTSHTRRAAEEGGPSTGGPGGFRELSTTSHELQRLPVTALVLAYGPQEGREVVLADANPAIFGLPRSTVEDLDEARLLAKDRPVAHASDPGGLWGGGLPPNLGPPPQRLDWR